MTLSSKAAFHSTYGHPLAIINAGVAAVTLFGSHEDGDAGHKLSIWVTCYFNITWVLAMERGDPKMTSQLFVVCADLFLAISVLNCTQKMSVATPKRRDWKVCRWTRSYDIFLTTNAILISSLVV